MERSQAARKKSAVTTTFVALLRGVNVGPANRLTMAALRAAFEGAGGGKVETLLQSGNVVFDAPVDEGEARRRGAAGWRETAAEPRFRRRRRDQPPVFSWVSAA